MTLPKTFDPHKIEDKWYNSWLEANYFAPKPTTNGKYFSVVIPPPNVTGSLHMGHALNSTLQDIMVRYKRMMGESTLWVPGTDHAGIATQNVVENELAKSGITRQRLGRKAFLEKVWEWKKKYGGMIVHQLKRLGVSCDWDHERFTMDEGLSRAVKEVFVRLYNEGLIYKGKHLINWCPRCHTALSDLEVEHDQIQGSMYHIKYPLSDSPKDALVVATTRPETLLGDTAVAVNPDDERYTKLHGQNVLLPILKRQIPIITDSYVDTEFGTGALKITPGHDFNDFEIGKRHDLEVISVIDEKGQMTKEAGPYHGLDSHECRHRIVEDLKKQELLVKIEPHLHSVGHCYRCKSIVEPYQSDQWFVRTKPLAEPAIEAVRSGKTQFIPKNWENTYFEWMDNIKDWCISRQIWWGHQIPAYYCQECGQVMVEVGPPDKCKKCNSTDIKQDEDVLDTWFSSALWPFSTLGWPDDTKDLKDFYPTSLMVTAFDIIFFWVARMMMMGLKFMDDVPFRQVHIHALIRDEEGQKMSKSKGNVIDPLQVMEKYGTDAFRFSLSAFAAQGRDISLSLARVEGYRNFANKIWNAARYVLISIGDKELGEVPKPEDLTLADKWVYSCLQETIGQVHDGLNEMHFNEAASAIYQFFWHQFCDWYVELSKHQLKSGDAARECITRFVLHDVLAKSLKLLHPFMPFITEEIWSRLRGEPQSIMIAPMPEVEKDKTFPKERQNMQFVLDIINAVRRIRGENNIPPSKKVPIQVVTKDKNQVDILTDHKKIIKDFARASDFTIKGIRDLKGAAATGLVSSSELYIGLEGIVNVDEEKKRLSKEIGKLQKELEFVNKKLANPKFVSNAPPDVVAEHETRAADFKDKLETLKAKLEELEKAK